MTRKATWTAQLLVVLFGALALKLHYSTASPDQLRWILAPTTFLVELLSGTSFKFESYAGYMSSDHTFLIAASCAGVNFLITAFLVLTLKRLWTERRQPIAWNFIPGTALLAYLTTIVANTVRICIALRLRELPRSNSWLEPNQLHRGEGIFIYFGFLLLLFMLTEKQSARFWDQFRRSLFPLLIYYATTFGIPLANGAYRQGREFWEYSLFVFLIPLLLIVPLAALNSSCLKANSVKMWCRRLKRGRNKNGIDASSAAARTNGVQSRRYFLRFRAEP
jgi:exosortase K